MNFSRIVYISDLFRPDFRDCMGFIRYVKDVFSFPIKQVFDLDFNDSFLEPDDTLTISNGFSVKKFFELNGISIQTKSYYNRSNFQTQEVWSKIFAREPSIGAVNYLKDFFYSGDLVFGYETPPVLLKAFDNLNITYIDVRISSMKFFVDLIFGFKTNNSELFYRIFKYKLPEELLYYQANLLKSRSKFWKSDGFNKKPFRLIIGQVSGDSSLIWDGRMCSLGDFLPEILKIKNECSIAQDDLYYKYHPSCVDDKQIKKFLDKVGIPIIPNNLNMYDLMGNDNLRVLYAISSGTLQEAKYFGVDSHYFRNSIFDYIAEDKSDFQVKYINVFQHCLRPYFWQDIIGNSKKCLPMEYYKDISENNQLRSYLNLYWSFK